MKSNLTTAFLVVTLFVVSSAHAQVTASVTNPTGTVTVAPMSIDGSYSGTTDGIRISIFNMSTSQYWDNATMTWTTMQSTMPATYDNILMTWNVGTSGVAWSSAQYEIKIESYNLAMAMWSQAGMGSFTYDDGTGGVTASVTNPTGTVTVAPMSIDGSYSGTTDGMRISIRNTSTNQYWDNAMMYWSSMANTMPATYDNILMTWNVGTSGVAWSSAQYEIKIESYNLAMAMWSQAGMGSFTYDDGTGGVTASVTNPTGTVTVAPMSIDGSYSGTTDGMRISIRNTSTNQYWDNAMMYWSSMANTMSATYDNMLMTWNVGTSGVAWSSAQYEIKIESYNLAMAMWSQAGMGSFTYDDGTGGVTASVTNPIGTVTVAPISIDGSYSGTTDGMRISIRNTSTNQYWDNAMMYWSSMANTMSATYDNMLMTWNVGTSGVAWSSAQYEIKIESYNLAMAMWSQAGMGSFTYDDGTGGVTASVTNPIGTVTVAPISIDGSYSGTTDGMRISIRNTSTNQYWDNAMMYWSSMANTMPATYDNMLMTWNVGTSGVAWSSAQYEIIIESYDMATAMWSQAGMGSFTYDGGTAGGVTASVTNPTGTVTAAPMSIDGSYNGTTDGIRISIFNKYSNQYWDNGTMTWTSMQSTMPATYDNAMFTWTVGTSGISWSSAQYDINIESYDMATAMWSQAGMGSFTYDGGTAGGVTASVTNPTGTVTAAPMSIDGSYNGTTDGIRISIFNMSTSQYWDNGTMTWTSMQSTMPATYDNAMFTWTVGTSGVSWSSAQYEIKIESYDMAMAMWSQAGMGSFTYDGGTAGGVTASVTNPTGTVTAAPMSIDGSYSGTTDGIRISIFNKYSNQYWDNGTMTWTSMQSTMPATYDNAMFTWTVGTSGVSWSSAQYDINIESYDMAMAMWSQAGTGSFTYDGGGGGGSVTASVTNPTGTVTAAPMSIDGSYNGTTDGIRISIFNMSTSQYWDNGTMTWTSMQSTMPATYDNAMFTWTVGTSGVSWSSAPYEIKIESYNMAMAMWSQAGIGSFTYDGGTTGGVTASVTNPIGTVTTAPMSINGSYSGTTDGMRISIRNTSTNQYWDNAMMYWSSMANTMPATYDNIIMTWTVGTSGVSWSSAPYEIKIESYNMAMAMWSQAGMGSFTYDGGTTGGVTASVTNPTGTVTAAPISINGSYSGTTDGIRISIFNMSTSQYWDNATLTWTTMQSTMPATYDNAMFTWTVGTSGVSWSSAQYDIKIESYDVAMAMWSQAGMGSFTYDGGTASGVTASVTNPTGTVTVAPMSIDGSYSGTTDGIRISIFNMSTSQYWDNATMTWSTMQSTMPATYDNAMFTWTVGTSGVSWSSAQYDIKIESYDVAMAMWSQAGMGSFTYDGGTASGVTASVTNPTGTVTAAPQEILGSFSGPSSGIRASIRNLSTGLYWDFVMRAWVSNVTGDYAVIDYAALTWKILTSSVAWTHSSYEFVVESLDSATGQWSFAGMDTFTYAQETVTATLNNPYGTVSLPPVTFAGNYTGNANAIRIAVQNAATKQYWDKNAGAWTTSVYMIGSVIDTISKSWYADIPGVIWLNGQHAVLIENYKPDSSKWVSAGQGNFTVEDLTAPVNNLVLNGKPIDVSSTHFDWNPWNITEPDKDSIGLFWSTSRFPEYPADSVVTGYRMYGFSKSTDTIGNLVKGQTYYFSMMVRDVNRNWSATTSSSRKSIIMPTYMGPNWFVNAAAPAGGNGSLTAPFDSLHKALGVAKARDTIRVATGVYPYGSGGVRDSAIIMLGSFDGSFSSRTPQVASSIIDAQGNTYAMLALTRKTVIDGFSFANFPNIAVDMKSSSDNVLANCRFAGSNQAVRVMSSPAVTIKHCVFSRNAEGVYLENNQIPARLINNTFVFNGRGVSESGSAIRLANNIFAFNRNAYYESSVLADSMQYNSFFGNDTLVRSGSGSLLTLEQINTQMGPTNGALDPAFVDTSISSTDLRLQAHSACIDAADPLADYSLEPLPNGSRRDLGAYGNTPWATSRDITPPSVQSLQIADMQGYTREPEVLVTFQVSEADSFRISMVSDTSNSVWKAYASSALIGIATSTQGQKIIGAQFKDLAGNRTAWVLDTTIYDTVAPASPAVVVADKSGYTKATTVSMTLSATGADSMRTAVDTTAAGWKAFATTDSIKLGGIGGQVVVRAQFKDRAGNISGWVSDTTTLDLIVPTIVVALPETSSVATWPGAIIGTASDMLSGIASVQLSLRNIETGGYWDGSAWGTTVQWLNATGTTSWSLSIAASALSQARYEVRAISFDRAGNTSVTAADTFVFISKAPTAFFTATPLSGAAPLTVQFADSSQGVISDLTWSFGDGTTASGKSASRVYVNRGTYRVTLIAKGPGGSTVASRDITVSDTTRPEPVTAVVVTQLGASFAKLSWTSSVSKDVDSVRVCASLSTMPQSPTGGEYRATVVSATSTATLAGIAPVGGNLYAALFVRDSSANWSLFNQLATAVAVLPDSTAPVNNIQLVLASIKDTAISVTVKTAEAAKGDARQIRLIHQFGTPPAPTNSSFITLPVRDTLITLVNTKTPGSWYVSTVLLDSSGNVSPMRIDSIRIANTAPVVIMPRDTAVLEKAMWQATVKATDVNGDSIAFSLAKNPAGITLNKNVLQWTPLNEHVGVHRIAVRATDSRGAFSVDSFTMTVINVNDRPSISLRADSVYLEDSLAVITVVTIDPDIGDSLTVTALRLPAWLTLAGGKIQGRPANRNVGFDTVIVMVRDKGGLTDTTRVAFRIQNTNDVPVLVSKQIPDTVYENAAVTAVIRVADVDIGDSLWLKWTAPLEWLTVKNVVRADTVWTFTFAGTPRNPHTGLKQLGLQVMDRAGASVTLSHQIMIIDVNNEPVTSAVRRLAGGAVEYQLSAIDDHDSVFSFESAMYRDSDTGQPFFSLVSKDTRIVISPLTDGIYFFQVRARDSDSLADSTPWRDTVRISGASQHVFADTAGWQMIGIPARSVKADTVRAGGSLAYWNEGGDERFIYSYYTPSAEITSVVSGKGYWRKSARNVHISLSSADIVTTSQEIVLNKAKRGWNQISSPYLFPVKWTGGGSLWKWNKTTNDFEESDSIIDPWTAYWVKTDTSKKVVLNPVPVFERKALAKGKASWFVDRSEWRIRVGIVQGNRRDAGNLIGFSRSARNGNNRFDRPEPPRMEGDCRMFFKNRDASAPDSELSSDVRKWWDAPTVYQLGYETGVGQQTARMEFEGVTDLNGVYLFIKDGNSIIPLTKDTSIALTAESGTRYRTVFASDKPNLNVPLKFAFSTPYPNPFGPMINIRYVLPYRWDKSGMLIGDSYKVKLRIYDSMGRIVKELVSRSQKPGAYEVKWKSMGNTGRRIAAGTYIVRLEAEPFVATARITSLR